MRERFRQCSCGSKDFRIRKGWSGFFEDDEYICIECGVEYSELYDGEEGDHARR